VQATGKVSLCRRAVVDHVIDESLALTLVQGVGNRLQQVGDD
jgi:hypothetical protein